MIHCDLVISQVRYSWKKKNALSLAINFPIALQFRICLNESLGLIINDEDFGYLVHKYGHEKEDKIDYMAFQAAMENGKILAWKCSPGSQCSLVYITDIDHITVGQTRHLLSGLNWPQLEGQLVGWSGFGLRTFFWSYPHCADNHLKSAAF